MSTHPHQNELAAFHTQFLSLVTADKPKQEKKTQPIKAHKGMVSKHQSVPPGVKRESDTQQAHAQGPASGGQIGETEAVDQRIASSAKLERALRYEAAPYM